MHGVTKSWGLALVALAACGSEPAGEIPNEGAPAGFDCTGASLQSASGGLALVRLRCGFLQRAASIDEHGLVLSNVVAVDVKDQTFVAYLPPSHPRLAIDFWGADAVAAGTFIANPDWAGAALDGGTELFFLVQLSTDSTNRLDGIIRWRTAPEGPCPSGCWRSWSVNAQVTTVGSADSTSVGIFDFAPDSPLDDGRGGLLRVRAFDGRQVPAGATLEPVALFLAGAPQAVALDVVAGPGDGDLRIGNTEVRTLGMLSRVEDRLSYTPVDPWPTLGLGIPNGEVTTNGVSFRLAAGSTEADVVIRVTDAVIAKTEGPRVSVDGAVVPWPADVVEVVVPMAPGAHEVMAVDDAGRIAQQTVTVVSNQQVPALSISASPAGPVRRGTAVELTAVVDPVGVYRYDWFAGGMSLGGGPSIAVLPDVTTVYELRLLDATTEVELVRANRTVEVAAEDVRIEVGVSGAPGGQIEVMPLGETCEAPMCGYSVNPGVQLTLTARARADAMPMPLFDQWQGDCTGSTPSVMVAAVDGLTCRAVFSAGVACTPVPSAAVLENGQLRTPPVVVPAASVRAGQVVLDASASMGTSNRTFAWRLLDLDNGGAEVARDSSEQWTLPTNLTSGRRYEAQLTFGCGLPSVQANTAVIFDIQ